jgi:hypothetical protein
MLQGKGIWSNLQTLRLWNFTMASEDDLSTFLFEVLPSFPKLSLVEFSRNRIKSFQTIAQRFATKEDLMLRAASGD